MFENNLHPHTSQSGSSLADNKEQRQENDAATMARAAQPACTQRFTILVALVYFNRLTRAFPLHISFREQNVLFADCLSIRNN